MAVRYICPFCTTNRHLKDWIQANGETQTCALCGAEGQMAVDVGRFAEYIDNVIRRHYYPGDDVGEHPLGLICRVAGVSEEVATLVMNVKHDDENLGQSSYDYGPLSFAGRWSQEHADRWERVKQVVKHEARFLGTETRGILATLFRDIEKFCGGIAVRP